MNAKPVVFRIRPEPVQHRTRYLKVVVWPTAKAMRAHKRRTGLTASWNTAAYCSQVTHRKYPSKRAARRGARMRTLPIFAEVHFSRNRLFQVIITHELFHATLAYGRRIKMDFRRLDADDSVNDDEERLAYVHGWLCREFVRRATLLGLYGEDQRRQRRDAERSGARSTGRRDARRRRARQATRQSARPASPSRAYRRTR